MGLAVCEESVEVMNSTAEGISALVENIKTATAALEGTFDNNEAKLGPHSAQISELIDEVKAISDDGHGPTLKLVLKLRRMATAYQDEIDRQRYGRSR